MVEVHSRAKARTRLSLSSGSTRIPRIVVIGSESTGKTTLAGQLAAFLGTDWLPEYARVYAESIDRPLTASDVEPIARGQARREDEVAARLLGNRGSLLVADTDLVSTTVYAEHYYGACPPWIMDACRRRLASLYLLADIDLPWESDRVRDQPAARREIHGRFVNRLAELDANVQLVWGAGDSRFQNALAAVRGWRTAKVSG